MDEGEQRQDDWPERNACGLWKSSLVLSENDEILNYYHQEFGESGLRSGPGWRVGEGIVEQRRPGEGR